MIVTVEEVRAHCRVGDDYPAEQLTPYIAAAEDAVSAHLNRAIYETQEALTAALDALPDVLAQAQADYDAAEEAAEAEEDETRAAAMLAVAKAKQEAVQRAGDATLNGIVVNSSIKAAVLLTVGHLFAHREDVVVGASVAQLPMGVHALLRPYRLVMMP